MEDDVLLSLSKAVALVSMKELDEYAHLCMDTANTDFSPAELLAGLMSTAKESGASVHDAYAFAVPPTFCHVAIRMLMEGLRQDAEHVCHEIMFNILDMTPEERKAFWDAHDKDQKEAGEQEPAG